MHRKMQKESISDLWKCDQKILSFRRFGPLLFPKKINQSIFNQVWHHERNVDEANYIRTSYRLGLWIQWGIISRMTSVGINWWPTPHSPMRFSGSVPFLTTTTPCTSVVSFTIGMAMTMNPILVSLFPLVIPIRFSPPVSMSVHDVSLFGSGTIKRFTDVMLLRPERNERTPERK